MQTPHMDGRSKHWTCKGSHPEAESGGPPAGSMMSVI